MKNTHRTILLLLLFFSVSCQWNKPGVSDNSQIEELHEYAEGLALAKADNGRWGYVNEQKEWVIPPQYQYAADFSDGVAIVSNTPETNFEVISSSGEHIAKISVDGIRILEHFHDGFLIYQDQLHRGYGLLDKQGNIVLHADPSYQQPSTLNDILAEKIVLPKEPQGNTRMIATVSPRERMNQVMYWLYESARIAAAQPADSAFREVILHYTECLRTAYEVKDIDFINQAFSDDALIIVGKMIRQQTESGGYLSSSQVEYNLRSKKQYLQQLQKVFAANENIRLSFSQQKVVQHPTKQGFYGVTLKQGYRSNTYSDEGYLFLLWDFRHPEQPQIHVRTWQPAMMDINKPLPESQVFSFSDFTLE